MGASRLRATDSTGVVAALVAVDLVGAVTAWRHRVAGEPLGVGGSLDVRRPLVLALWGSGLSAPLFSLALALAVRRRPERRVLGALFALGALSEPIFWGRRPCPRGGRMVLLGHFALATTIAVLDGPTDRSSP